MSTSASPNTASLVSVLTGLADDELILGHRHSEWTGYAPHIEEDVAFSSIAQDEIGHAASYYRLIAELTGDDADRLALGRSASEYRHAILCERANRDWAYALARHWIYDTADAIRLESLEETAHERFASLVTKIRREERYHAIHARSWLKRVALGPVEGRTKLAQAVAEASDDAGGLFEEFELEAEALTEGWLPVPSGELHKRFLEATAIELDELGLALNLPSSREGRAEFVASSSGDLIAAEGPDSEGPAGGAGGGTGGRRGRHTAEFDEVWDVMTVQYREHPGATW